jgi:sugar lactone lactonase YvrE
MRAIQNSFTNPVRPLAAGTWLALFSVLTLCLFAPVANAGSAPTLPIVVTGAAVQVGALTGGWNGSQSPLSGTFAIGANGNVYVGNGWGSNTLEMVPGGATTAILPIAGSAATIDSYGNLYFGAYYSNNIYKIPYNAATGTYAGFTSTSYPGTNCKGGTQDTAPCIFAPGVAIQGYADLAFDAQGNFFFAEGTVPSTNPNAIYECNLACIASPTGTPKLLFADSVAMGAMGIDPWGNIWFTDGAQGGVSNVKELPLTSGTYAATPTTVISYNSTQSWNGLSGLAVASSGTVYFGDDGDGIFALPNTQSGPNVAGLYMVSRLGGKAIALDSRGNLYQMNYNNGDVISMIPANTLQLGASTVDGTAATATATIIDSAASCTPTLKLALTEAGASTTEFSAGTPGSCSTALGTGNGTFSGGVTLSGAATSVKLAFTPAMAGERSAAFSITDSANSAAGTVTVTGVGQNALVNLDPGVTTAFATGFTTPASVVSDVAGDLFIADPGAGEVYEIASGTTTLTSVGSFTAPATLALDANGNLYVADSSSNQIYEIANSFSGSQGGFTAGTQSVAVSSTSIIGGLALSAPNGLAIGPDGVLYISDSKNARVVTFNPVNGVLGVTQAISANGLQAPAGLAVDASGNLYVADPTAGSVFIFTPASGFSTITVGGSSPVAEPAGVAVEPSGSLLIADKLSGSIVRVPIVSGSLSVSSAYQIEKNPQSAQSLSMDAEGDLYSADISGGAVYAIQRTAASVNFGLVSDNQTSTLGVNLMNSGNAAWTIAGFTQPANTLFTLAPGSGNNNCGPGSGPAGAYCQFSAIFSPVTASGTGSQSGSGTINFSPSGSETIYLSGSTTTSNILQQTITGFSPETPLLAGQQITLSATGGASGNPVTFSIDALSACPTCASINGDVLTTTGVGVIKVDANQAGGKASNGNTYGPASAQVTITINSAVASDVKAILASQITWFPKLNNGGFTDGANPAGGSFAINQQGNVYVGSSYGGDVEVYNPSNGTVVAFASISNPSGIAVDSNNNLYISHQYNSIILKVPYVNGAYVAVTDASSAPACNGTDTALCQFVNMGGNLKAIYFDPAGNFWAVTVPSFAGGSKIIECTTACITNFNSGKGSAPTVVYTDVNAVSQVSVDPWGNLFFTDGVYASSGNFGNLEASSSNLYELHYSSGAFAATPVLLQTYTNAIPASYDNQLDGVAVGADGTVYYATQNEGIFAVPNTQSGGPDVAHQYAVTNLGAKCMEMDRNGNFWTMVYHGSGDSLGEAIVSTSLTNVLTIPTGQLYGAAVTNSATVVDNAASCSATANLVFTSSNPEFSGTSNNSCGSIAPIAFANAITSSKYSATLSFQATAVLTQTATLTITDTNNGGIGTAAVSSFGSATPQNITFTLPTNTTSTYAPGLTITLGATGGGSGNPVIFTVDAASTGAGTITNNVLTVTQAGTIVIDANQAAGANAGTYYMAATQAQLSLTVQQASQTLTFLPPLTPVTYAPGLKFALSATPGITGNPVVFTVDSSSTATATISSNILTVTGAGNLVIDANEAGTVNYAAAAQEQQTVMVNQATQAISFVPPAAAIHYVPNPVASVCSAPNVGVNVNCNQITLVATGGASGKPVVFTVDKTSTATASISGTTLTFASTGNVVVDANQASNNNYLAAPQVQETIAILPALTTQTINFVNPGTLVAGNTFTLTATSTSGLPVSYTAAPSSVCTVSGSVVSAVAAGTCTVTAFQPGDNTYFAMAAPVAQAFTINPVGMIPAMNLSLSMANLVLQPGTVGVSQLTINSANNFAGTVSFTCSGAPSGYTCTLNPNPIFVPQGGSVSTTVSVSPTTSSSSASGRPRPYLPAATLAVALCFFGLRRRNRLQLLLLAVVVLAGMGFVSGCGGTNSSTAAPGTSSTITITATSNGTTKTATMTVLVQ